MTARKKPRTYADRKTPIVSMTLPQETRERLATMAQERGLSGSSLVAQLIDEAWRKRARGT